MAISTKAAALAFSSALILSGCGGSSDVNPYGKIFGTVCSVNAAVDSGINCIDGELPEVLDAVDEVLTSVTDLLDALDLLSQNNPLFAALPIDQITAGLNGALEQATVAINDQLIGALPDEVAGIVDQALVDAVSTSLIEVTNLISPALAALPDAAETGDPLELVRAALSGVGSPTDVISAVTQIQNSIIRLQSGVNTAALVGLASDLLAASNTVGDAPAQLAGALEGLAGSLSGGNPEDIAAALEGLTSVVETDAVADLLATVGGVTDIINLSPDDLTGLASNDVIQGIGNTVGNLLGLG